RNARGYGWCAAGRADGIELVALVEVPAKAELVRALYPRHGVAEILHRSVTALRAGSGGDRGQRVRARSREGRIVSAPRAEQAGIDGVEEQHRATVQAAADLIGEARAQG